MSTLTENIAAIKNSADTMAVKYQKLRVELGLDHENVCNVLEIPYYGSSSRLNDAVNNELRRSRRSRSSERVADTRETANAEREAWLEGIRNAASLPFTFGVEIECLLRSGVNACQLLSGAGITNHDSTLDYNHRDSATSYKIMNDASLVAGAGQTCREIVSPILKNFDTLKTVCGCLNAAGTKVNKTCGLHVHIGAADLTGDQQVNVFINYQKLEGLINTFMAESRRNGFFCKTLNFNFDNCHSINDIYNIIYSRELNSYNCRYYKVNPCAYSRHKTIEFRQHQGSTDFKKIQMWVNFCEKLVAFSKNVRLTENITDINAVPFLNDAEKAFFAARIQKFSSR